MPVLNQGTDKASAVQLSQCTLVAPTGVSVELLELITELNIFEDLFSNTMTGNVVLNDSNNLINTLPIMGYEFLMVVFEKPNSSLQFKKTFRVYKMTDRQRTTEQNETYILHFASEELLLSEQLLISKTYTDMTISLMINDIARNYLKISPTKFPQSQLRSTLGLHTITISGWKPLYAINFLSRYALSQYKSASFMFYEDRDGYHFISLEELSQQTPLQPLLVSPKNFGFERNPNIPDLKQQSEGAEAIAFPESFDTLRNIYAGMYAGLLIGVDPLRRRITSTLYNGYNQFLDTKHLNPYPFISLSQDRMGRTVSTHPESVKKTVISTIGHDQLSYAQGKQILRSNRITEWMIPRMMYLTGMHATRMSVALPGSVVLKVGGVLDVKLPASQEQTPQGKKLDALYSGKYMITALRHKINRRSYACIAEVCKDSVSTILPDLGDRDIISTLKKG